jgi:hypothetical protein
MIMKKSYYIPIFIILALALAIGLIIISKPHYDEPNTGLSPEQLQAVVAARAADAANYNQAVASNDVSFCALIGDEQSLALCQETLALQSGDLEICDDIDNEEVKQECLNQVRLKSSLSGKNIAGCLEIDSDMQQKYCVETMASGASVVDCQKFDNRILQEACLSTVYYNQARDSKQATICQNIPELVKRANCLSELQGIDLHSDADNDGLDFLQEIVAGINPNLADSDGDGYSDSDEQNAGFNPAGAGGAVPLILTYGDFCQEMPDDNLRLACQEQFYEQYSDVVECVDIMDKAIREYCQEVVL